MRIAICDDDKLFVEDIKRKVSAFLDKHKFEYKINVFTNGMELYDFFVQNNVDIVLLDIDMPNNDGFFIAEKMIEIREDATIIFVTSKNDLVYQSFVYRPFWFVRKSHIYELDDALAAFLNRIQNNMLDKVFALKTESGIIDVDPLTACYFEASKHYVIIHYLNNEKVKVRARMIDIESQLNRRNFIRVHNGYIVNLRFVEKITYKSVRLSTGNEINLARDRVSDVKRAFQKYLGSIR